jgi:hypothetical protein
MRVIASLKFITKTGVTESGRYSSFIQEAGHFAASRFLEVFRRALVVDFDFLALVKEET